MKKKQNKGRSKDFKRNDKVDAKARDKEGRESKAYGNDISWYVNNPQMLVDACNISFANVLSKPIAVADANIPVQDQNGTWYYLDCPGVMAINVVPTIGTIIQNGSYHTGDFWDSAVNMAARAEWSYIRQRNAGAKNYDAPDLMMYHLAMDNIYMYWSWMVRLYGYMRLYSFKNKYYPIGILRAMGLTDSQINNLRGSMADFRTYINLFAAQMSSFAVPINLPYVKRHLWLFQNAFMDSSPTKSQLYIYNPAWLYKLEETDAPMRLVRQTMPFILSGTNMLQYIKSVGDTMLSAITQSESCNIMSGDILKAYEASGIYGFESIPDDFTLAPMYDETVLSQIHNLTIVDYTHNGDTYIEQDPDIDAGFIYQVLPGSLNMMNRSVIIDSRFETPTPTDVMYATRLTAVQNNERAGHVDCGSEVVVGLEMYTDATSDTYIFIGTPHNLDYASYPIWLSSIDDAFSYGEIADFLELMSVLTKFDWHPIMPFAMFNRMSGASLPDKSMARYIGDVDNFAVVEGTTIAKMHKVALNSEFGLPYTLTNVK